MAWTEEEDKKQSPEEVSVENNGFEGYVSEGNASEGDEKVATADVLQNNASVKNEKPQESDSDSKLWSLLESTLKEGLIEKRRARRWKIAFRLVYFIVFVSLIGLLVGQSSMEGVNIKNDYVAVILLEGEIGAGKSVDANVVLSLLDDAYKNPGIRALVLKMNSPGGSPVHAGIIYDAIERKKAKYPNVPVYVVVEDLAASGGYYIAAAADEILVDKASLVGSIGVISAGFDATELLKKIGVERRVFTAGENKAFLDPFMPMEDSSAKKWQAVLDETHQQFIKAVKEGRGARLKDNPDLFTGMVFSGVKAVDLGLADGLSSFHQLVNETFNGTKVVYFLEDKNTLEEVAQSFGIQLAHSLLQGAGLR